MKKVCLVTGSTSGIGLATAKKLCQNNIVIINARKLPPKNFIMQNFKKPENVHFFKCDISKKEDVLKLKSYIIDKFGKLDFLVCNAGAIPLPCGIEDITNANVEETIDINLKGTFYCLKEFGEIIKNTSKCGSIVTLTSVDGIIGDPYAIIYSAAKAGIISLTKSFARHYGQNIRVNAVAPGIVDTPLENLTDNDPNASINVSIIQRMGKPDEIAEAIIFLLSDKSSFITGQTLIVDGGYTLK